MYKASIRDHSFSIEEKDNEFFFDGQVFKADVLEYRSGKFHILHAHQSHSAEVISADPETKTCIIKINGKDITVSLKDRYDELLHEMGIDAVAGKMVNNVKAPMPGMVLNVMVENGQVIKKGDTIVVLEAMKMENILKSPSDGTVRKIHVSKGDKVEKNQVMIDLG